MYAGKGGKDWSCVECAINADPLLEVISPQLPATVQSSSVSIDLATITKTILAKLASCNALMRSRADSMSRYGIWPLPAPHHRFHTGTHPLKSGQPQQVEVHLTVRSVDSAPARFPR